MIDYDEDCHEDWYGMIIAHKSVVRVELIIAHRNVGRVELIIAHRSVGRVARTNAFQNSWFG